MKFHVRLKVQITLLIHSSEIHSRKILKTILGDRVIVEDGQVKKHLYQIDGDARVRIIRLHSARVVEDSNRVMLYHNYDNSR